MRKITQLLVLLTLVSITSLKSQNLVAYYKLDGHANAFFGNANGTIYGNVIADTNRFNQQSSSMRFADSYSDARIPNSFDLAQKTFNFWLKVDTITSYGPNSFSPTHIFTIDNGSLNHGMVYVMVYRTMNQNKLQLFGGSYTPVEITLNMNTWNKITITYKNSEYKLYINNQYKGNIISTNIHSVDGYNGIVLGDNRSMNNDNSLNGLIDDLSIYDYAMDSAQIANITEATCDFTNIINVYDTTFIAVNDTLIVDILSSTNQTFINTIKVYPNPAKDFLYINNGNFTSINNYIYEIINTNGAKIFTQRVSTAETTIDINTWPEGIYFLNIYNATGGLVEVKKIILN